MGSPLSPSTQLDRYEIRSQIGAGGMGEVYLAQDIRLERTVALKVLPADVAADRQRMQRFIQEAKAASGLNHPNILTVYEIGQAGPTHFIATEYIDGKTLRQILSARRIEMAEVLDISMQMASALAAAHAAGIIHRDIKPENIMIRRDGIVKVLDFGLAKLCETVDPEQKVDAEAATAFLVQTEPGVVMGTAAYMSPEQARGKNVDARTDIFSLGAVIYEMLSGRAPFAGETSADIIGALIHKEPQPLSTLVSNTPAELQHIVSKALRKDRDERYQTVKSLLVDLKTLKQELDFSAKLERSIPPDSKEAPAKNSVTTATANAAMETADTQATIARPTSRVEYMVSRINQHRVTFAVGLVLLAAISFSYWSYTRRAPPIESVAVLPFVNESGNAEVEYLSDGMTESLINSLSQLPSLSVKARSSVFRYKGKNIEPLQVASELSVQAILNGRVVQRGDDLSLYLSLVDARNGDQLWGEQYNRKLRDLLSLQNEIARDVSQKLRARLSGTDEQKLAKNYTQNAEAYQLYLKGRYFWYRRTPEDFQKSRDYFQRAIDLDPTYALAYSGLADFYGVLAATGQLPPNETWAKQEAIVHKALQLDPHLAEVHNSLAGLKRYYYRDWHGAEQEFKRAIELDPNYAEAHSHYGGHLSIMGRFDEALIERKRAIELDPISPFFHQRLADTLYFMRRYDEAIEQYRKALELHQTNAQFHERLGNAYEQKGMFDQAIAEWRAAAALARGKNEELATMLESTYKESGFNAAIRAFAQERLKQLNERARRGEYIPAMDFARLYVRLGASEQAFLWLEKASEERNTLVFNLKHDPAFDSLRNHTRFQAVLRRVGLPQ